MRTADERTIGKKGSPHKGHRNLRSTLVYARIATEELREVTDNYARLL